MTRAGNDRLPPAVISAIEQIESGLAQLYSATSLKPPRQAITMSLEERVRGVIERRRLRFTVLPEDLFSDPAWDLLLELYLRQLEGRQTYISQITAAVPAPPTTSLRWIERLDTDALIVRRKDPHDARRVWIDLSQYGRSLMDRYFQRSDDQRTARIKSLFEPSRDETAVSGSEPLS